MHDTWQPCYSPGYESVGSWWFPATLIFDSLLEHRFFRACILILLGRMKKADWNISGKNTHILYLPAMKITPDAFKMLSGCKTCHPLSVCGSCIQPLYKSWIHPCWTLSLWIHCHKFMSINARAGQSLTKLCAVHVFTQQVILEATGSCTLTGKLISALRVIQVAKVNISRIVHGHSGNQ